jgi:hypothetical protein
VVCRAPRCRFTRAAQRDNPPTRAERRSGSESSTHADRPRMVTQRQGQWWATTRGGAGAMIAARTAH